jgi:hypothetical protein
MLTIPLCHKLDSTYVANAPQVSEKEAWWITSLHASANMFSESIIARRELVKRESQFYQEPLKAGANAVQQITEIRPSTPQRLLSYLYHGISCSDEALPPALAPLNDCILAIRWEFFTMSCPFVSDGASKIFILLRAAALYQAGFECVSTSLMVARKESC